MATIRTPGQTWIAKNALIYLGDSTKIHFGGTVTLSSVFATSGALIAGACKNITITPPETAQEKVDTMGQSNGGGFQNALLDEKPVGTATLTGTLLLGEDETVEDIISGSLAASPSGYARRQYGTDNTSSVQIIAAVVLNTPSNNDYITFGFDNAKFTKLGDTRIGGADGHWEQDFTILCLPKDFFLEFKD